MPTTYAIPNGATAMNAIIYTGTGGTQNLTSNVQNWPDFIWIKNRNSSGSHSLQDSSRGFGSATKLSTNSTNAENNGAGDATDPQYGYISAANSTSFSAYAGTNPAQVNTNGATYVAWMWNAGSNTTTSNTSGTITSTVSANATAGFSIIKFVGNATAGATVGHGLSAAPTFYVVKSRTSATNWSVYAKAANGGNGQNGGFYINSTNAWTSDSGFWNNTSATASVLSLGSGGDVNANGQNHVIYAWTPIAGFSAFGSYTGNGSADGPFVYTGFRPKYVLIKASSRVENWHIHDTTRNPYNLADCDLYTESYNAETTLYNQMDILSNGFKLRSTYSGTNNNGDTYVYAAFAENPFKYALAR